jgi:antitoxin HicB
MEMPENREPKAYLRLPYARVLTPNEESGYSAEILEFPGCFAEGETVNEAFANLEEVAESWIESCLAQGQDIPPPSANESYSGRIALRLPRDLHGQAVRKAARNGVSLNQCLVTAIAAWVGADNLFERLAHRVQTSLVQQNLLQVVLVPGMLANVPLSTVMTTIGTPSVQIGIGEPIQKLTARPS